MLNRLATSTTLALACLAACSHFAAAQTGPVLGAAVAPLTGAMANITTFGAVADDKTMNTGAIQKAIDSLAAQGGGTVIIPAALDSSAAPSTQPAKGHAFLSGALFLKSGVNLRVEKGAILKGSTDTKDYPTMRTRIEGHFQDWLPALINADQIDHLKIDGEGTLDGSGTPFYAAFRAARGTNLGTPRPRLLFISKCKDASISGLHLLNSGFWNLHLYNCDGVTIDGLDIDAPRGSPSTDGIDVNSSRNITIKNTSISNNDDCIALKGSKGLDAGDDKDSPPVEHIRVSNCLFKMGGSLVTCGSEATIVRDVIVENCTVAGPNTRGINVLRLKLRTDTPQLYEDIHYNNITLDGAGTFINVTPWTQYETIPAGRQRPAHTVRNITLSNIHGAFGSFGTINPVAVNGTIIDTIEKITLENIDLKLNNGVPNFRGVRELVVKNVKINGSDYIPAPALTQPAAPAPQ